MVEGARARGFSRGEIVKVLVQKGYSRKEIDESLGIKKVVSRKKVLDDKIVQKKEYNYLEKIGLLFSRPTTFFDLVRENHMGPSIGLFASVSVISVILKVVVSLIFNGILGGNYFRFFGVEVWGFGAITIILAFIFTFISAGIVHASARMMGGKGSYVDCYNVVVYSLVPAMIIASIIPMIGFLSYVFSFVIMVYGIRSVYKLSGGKSTLVAFSPLILYVVLLVFIFGLLFGGIF